MTQLTKEAVTLLLGAAAIHAQRAHAIWVATGQAVSEVSPVPLANDSALEEHIAALEEAGMVSIEDNDDPMTRDTEPRTLLLTDKAVLWCFWLTHRTNFDGLELDAESGSVGDFLQATVTGLFS